MFIHLSSSQWASQTSDTFSEGVLYPLSGTHWFPASASGSFMHRSNCVGCFSSHDAQLIMTPRYVSIMRCAFDRHRCHNLQASSCWQSGTLQYVCALREFSTYMFQRINIWCTCLHKCLHIYGASQRNCSCTWCVSAHLTTGRHAGSCIERRCSPGVHMCEYLPAGFRSRKCRDCRKCRHLLSQHVDIRQTSSTEHFKIW